MRLEFEQLEQRLALSSISCAMDGPRVAYIGDAVEYEYVCVNRDQLNGAHFQDVDLSFFSEWETGVLDNIQWRLDGAALSEAGEGISFEPGETHVFTGTATVPEGLDYFNLHVGIQVDPTTSGVDGMTTIVVDRWTNKDTIGASGDWHVGWRMIFDKDRWLQAVQPAGDLNGDGFGDAYIITIYANYGWIAEGERKFVFQRIRDTALGTETSMEIIPSEQLVLETSEPYDGYPHPTPRDWLPVGPRDGRWPIGDIDGDGYEDEFVGRPKDVRGVGTGTIFFGPDHRENFIVVSGQFLPMAIPGDTERWGTYAGALGDVNGDGFGDFYVGSYNWISEGFYVLHGRDFGRDLPADIDGSGTVDFADFLVLAYNYGNENMTRSEGDLDGDGLVAFSDFIVLRDTFEQSKADVPLTSS